MPLNVSFTISGMSRHSDVAYKLLLIKLLHLKVPKQYLGTHYAHQLRFPLIIQI